MQADAIHARRQSSVRRVRGRHSAPATVSNLRFGAEVDVPPRVELDPQKTCKPVLPVKSKVVQVRRINHTIQFRITGHRPQRNHCE